LERLNDRVSAARDAWKGLFASVLLHVAAAMAVLFAISVAPQARAPLVVDLTLEGPEGPAAGRPIPAPMPAPVQRSARLAEPASASAVPPLAAFRTETAPPAIPGAGSAEPSLSAPDLPGVPGGSASATIPGPSGATTSGAEPGSGETGEAGTKIPDRYLARHYAYIRDAIQVGIAYPAMARKMGWEGKVVVAFFVRSDGSVRDIRVVQGSGYPALDRGAVDAVRKASPFPRPPAEAEIVTPVVYRLE
jgi:protein TonB